MNHILSMALVLLWSLPTWGQNLDYVSANNNEDNRICMGDGDGIFSSCATVDSASLQTFTVRAVDLDGDGNLDTVNANWGAANTYCLGDGAGGFADCMNISSDTFQTVDTVIVDIDKDSDLDIVSSNYQQRNRICLNDGSLGFSCSDADTDTNINYHANTTDFNGDENPDMVFANITGDGVEICLGNGTGGFSACYDNNAGCSTPTQVLPGDWNEDNDTDVVVACAGSVGNKICLGDGDHSLSCSNVGETGRDTYDISSHDYNGNGNPDLVFANNGGNSGSINQFCSGDGDGTFSSCQNIGSDKYSSYACPGGDLDNDGDIDVVFANGNSNNSLINTACLNNGSAVFTCANADDGEFVTLFLALGDFNAPSVSTYPTPTPKLRLRRFRQGPFLIGWLWGF